MSRIPYQGFFRSLWVYLTKVRPAKKNLKEEVVGTDSLGNKYVLIRGDPTIGIKESRSVWPTEENVSTYAEQFDMNVPQEWDEWLRYRRNDPPTEEEIEMNQLKMLRMQQRVHELEKKELLERGEDVKQLSADLGGDGFSKTPHEEDLSEVAERVPFPTYDDLEQEPGEFHKRPK